MAYMSEVVKLLDLEREGLLCWIMGGRGGKLRMLLGGAINRVGYESESYYATLDRS